MTARLDDIADEMMERRRSERVIKAREGYAVAIHYCGSRGGLFYDDSLERILELSCVTESTNPLETP